jgi:nicotinate dehydrogenase subunit B
MGKHERIAATRRGLLKGAGAGALVVTIGGTVGMDFVRATGKALAQGAKPPLHPAELDSYIAVLADGRVSAFYGKMDMGHGLHTAVAQMVAEELDVPLGHVTIYMGDTRTSVNQGGASGSTGLQLGGVQMRMAAAEARRVLVEMAATKLGVTADSLTVNDGVVAAKSNPAQKISYRELIGGRYFNHKLDWNKQWGNPLKAVGKAKPKPHTEYKIIGKSFPREDIAPKVFSTEPHIMDHRVPGMVHGRMIRPKVAGSVPVKVDEASVKHIPGAKVVFKPPGFLGVVADTEWGAIKAAEQLKVIWSEVPKPFPQYGDLYDHVRKAKVVRTDTPKKAGDIAKSFEGAAKVVTAEYEWPFQSHASMAPATAVVEIKGSKATLWTGGQKPHFARDGVAAVLGLKQEDVDGIWLIGPGCYGRNDAGDCAMDCAVLAQAVGKPVRLQYSRAEGTQWDPKGPASVIRARAALDANNNVLGFEFIAKGFSRLEVSSNESQTKDCLAGHNLGHPLKPVHAFNIPANSYVFPNMGVGWETIEPFIERASPLRGAHLRDPNGPELQFAGESFIDEVAMAANMDPVEFRLKYAQNKRDLAVIQAAMQKSGWQPRVGPNRNQTGDILKGRGFAYSQRNGSRVAIVSEVEVNRRTGRVWARKFTVAHDCGQIVNPTDLKQCIEGNIVQGVSRAILEEVKFDQDNVTSVDWDTYPILDIMDTPETIDFVLLDYPDQPPTGAGEPSIRPVAGAIANAVFDATGVRIRRAPLTPDRVRQALSSA